MNTIVLKSYYLTRSLYWLIGIGILLSTFIFLDLDMSSSAKYQISTTIVGFGSIIVIYLNRLEPHYIKFDSDTFTIDYINKLIFKPATKIYLKKESTVLLKNDSFILYDNGVKQAIVRRKALDQKDWEILKKYFAG
ncbi:hypothetical protein [Mucilaginibacter sp. OK098]|uniref:hypothetical protein n=1 Tax=Mucilaginibacter sp. OK098 TaxID=1855297 RepID=UPI00091EA38D|nr:hypothetical protein [Mucilaginibacter sp. OK098]SHL98230.1 hypothetical protein SAMN05216524_101408 [Mucilaginibacter sp. OK098]